MAHVRYFPSIHDKMESRIMWPFFDPQPLRMKFKSFFTRNVKASVYQHTPVAHQVEAPAVRTVSDPLEVPDYRPLDAFSVAGRGDGGLASWSEADDICELSIRMKEIELCEMMRETSGVQEKKIRREKFLIYKPRTRNCIFSHQ